MNPAIRIGVTAALCVGAARAAAAQSWWLRFNGSAQHIELRGLDEDSILATAAVAAPTGGLQTPDGFAVDCLGTTYCQYFRAGRVLSGLPATAGVDMSMWGLGVRGLSVQMSARAYTDLNGGSVWPGTTPAFELFDAYAQYLHGGLTVQGGRLLEQGRLAVAGTSGLDGVRGDWRFAGGSYDVGGYAGWGLARGATLPVTSPAVDPLAEYQPSERQIVVGATGALHLPRLDVQAEYRREIDPATDYLVAERAAVSALVRPMPAVRIVAGADYDLGQEAWGSADLSVEYTARTLSATVGATHYRPFFDLWTVWGVFSPSPYNGVTGSVALHPIKHLQVRANGEWFRYDAAGVSVPAVPLTDRGWRWGVGATLTPAPAWSVDANLHRSLLPGASSSGIDTRVSWHALPQWEFNAEGGSLESPLEFRFQNDGVDYAGGAVDYHTVERWRISLNVDRYWQSAARPDAASFDFNQWRISAQFTLTLRSAADSWLPPAAPVSQP